ncbi:hypothetical protein F9C11_26340 [Amycolatopsis sp. VS8301801F10]
MLEALHAIDFLALGGHPLIRQARTVKEELCAARAAEASSFYRSGW